ncbi:CPG4 domain-containing protein [Trichostrongylus colubriformis]|uniref:CPG4 domain-containing protein n=1 Tax=Trichostrongylus colubriformis TaxID=6319 RepID=A0AAN8FBB0_TRICO
MRTQYVLLQLLAALSTLRADDFELSLTLDVTGVPQCIQACLSDLFYSVTELIHLQNPVAKFPSLCKTYADASLCVENQKETCVQTTLFEIALSGLDELCNERAEDLIPHKECLEQHAELVLKNCDQSCQLTSILMDLAGKRSAEELQKLEEDHDKMAKEVSSLCTAFGCMSSCVAHDLNVQCSPAGTIIVKALLKPFITGATIFEEIGARAKMSIYRQIPSLCYYLTNLKDVEGIAEGRPPAEPSDKNPEEAIRREIKLKEQQRKQKKAELERLFLMDAKQGI